MINVPIRPITSKEKLTSSIISHNIKGELKRWNTRKEEGDVNKIKLIKQDISEDIKP
jgi:hypothetical protein